MTQPFSRYIAEVTAFAFGTKAKAVYCFVLDGEKGTGGCPLIMGMLQGPEYRRRCEELIVMLRRSADLLQADIDRQVPT
jgi:hypothetical protein